MKIKVFMISVIITLVSVSPFFAQTFNPKTDLLLANFDLKPDEDDVMAAAALATVLKHPDFENVKYYAVAGAYGDQNHIFITSGVPDYYNDLFGKENKYWTNAHADWNNSVIRVTDKITPILKSGGKVFVQEAGQSNFTFDVLHAVIKNGITLATLNKNVVIVQHSKYNEKNTTPTELTWLKNNTIYIKVDDGNTDDNGTPGFRSKDSKWLDLAKSTNNPNIASREIWTLADAVCDEWESTWTNRFIKAGGVDFSDFVENWRIFELRDKADSLDSFWNRYVINKPLSASKKQND